MRRKHAILFIAFFILLLSCNRESSISGYWFGKHQIINGITSEFEFNRELFNFSQDSLSLTNMYFTPYLNTYVSRSQAYSYRIVENFLHCDSLNRFESTQIELLTNDTLQLKVNESVICFSKVDQYKQAESVELLKNKLKHNWILLNNREYFLKFHDIGYGLYGIKDINGNVNEGIMKIFKDGSELFISFSGSNSELLQVKSISSKTIECVNHIPIPSSYKIKLVEH